MPACPHTRKIHHLMHPQVLKTHTERKREGERANKIKHNRAKATTADTMTTKREMEREKTVCRKSHNEANVCARACVLRCRYC